MTDLIGIVVGALLTLCIYSYLIGDNPLYRLAVHILVGVSAGYAGVVVIRQVLVPIYRQIQDNPSNVNGFIWYVPLFFSFLLLLQRLPTIAWLSKLTVAFMIGIGAAVSLIGAISGTLWPQITAVSSDRYFLGQSVVVALLTAVTLASFQFTHRHRPNQDEPVNQSLLMRAVRFSGRVVLTITFGYLFAAALNTSLLIFSERLGFYIDILRDLIA